MKFLFLTFLGIIISCDNKKSDNYPDEDAFIADDRIAKSLEIPKIDTVKFRQRQNALQDLDLIDIQTINKNILVDLKYASTDNFMHTKLYDTINKAFLLKTVAERLSKVQDLLTSLKPGYKLIVYDAIRPLSVQWEMWKSLDSIPVSQRSKFVSNPKNGSVHNYGAAVDLSICDENGKPLDMGAGYDDIRQIAYPRMENYFLQKGELSLEQIENRKLLRKVMASQNFSNIPTEWWHFNGHSRATCASRFKILKSEF